MTPWQRARALAGAAAALALTLPMLLLGYLMILLGASKAALPMASRWARGCLRLMGLRLETRGLEQLPAPGRGYIAAATHASALDVLIYTAIVPPEMRYIAKRELQRLPFFGTAFRRSGNIFADRGGTTETRERFNTDLRAQAERPVFIYPEGTRTRDGRLQPLRRGFVHVALATGFPIIPMASRGAFEALPKGRWLPRSGPIEVRVGEAIPTETWKSESIDAHVAELHRALMSLKAELDGAAAQP